MLLGTHHTEATKRKLSLMNKGQIPWNTGKHHSPETKLKMSKSQTGRKHTELSKQKMRDSWKKNEER